MLRLNRANFSIKVQIILEKYYLQQMDGLEKVNLKDGYIERKIHGAMHASRAALWAFMMHNLLENLTPLYTDSSLKKIAQFINADTDSVVLLILITVVCHDAARRGEGQDLWEAKSGEIAAEVLKELGLNEKQATLFAKAITFKDEQKEYVAELKNAGISEQDYNHFDYIRKIVNLGDNLDLVRCVGEFKTSYIFDTLATVDSYNATLHDNIILNLIKAIHQLVYDQGDMLFACKIQDRNEVTVATHESRLSTKEKIQREHAENVFAVIFEEAFNNPVFQPYLRNNLFDVTPSRRYEGALKFDPFIHGTNTSIFSTLAKSEFQIMSPIEMMDEYQTAPMTGELTMGGYAAVHHKGKTAFAKMTVIDSQAFSLDSVLAKYTSLTVAYKRTSLSKFKETIESGVSKVFSNINLLLIYFTRARQTHESLEQIISASELKKLQYNLNITIQFFYFIQLLGTHINPDFEAIKKSGIKQHIKDAAYSLLTYENIIAKIKEYNIDMKAILENPTSDNLQKALLVLEFPKKCIIKVGFACENIEIEFPVTQFFCTQPNDAKSSPPEEEADHAFACIANNMGQTINQLFEKAVSQSLPKMTEQSKKHLAAFIDRLRILDKLVSAPQTSFILTDVQKYFLKKTYPIILVSENEDKITLLDNCTQEYRSLSRLKLGIDIKMIATDTNEHRLEIMKFLELNHVRGMQVILFDDLKTSKISKEKPSEPYHHEDGVPRLKWIAAQQIHKSQVFFKPKTTYEPMSMYSEKNIALTTQLVDEAKKYGAIGFTTDK